MSTRIELEYPYNERWRKGYVVTNPEGRKTLILFNSEKDRSSTQYARYLMAVKLGRFLTSEETVDHIDGDRRNNSIDNLQILSLAENIRKTFKKEDYHCVCPICGKEFNIPRQSVRNDESRTRILSGKRCCSRECGRRSASRTLKGRKIK